MKKIELITEDEMGRIVSESYSQGHINDLFAHKINRQTEAINALIDEMEKKEIECHAEKLLNRRDQILDLLTTIPVPVIFVWKPRNSTKELERANHLCQDLLGVSRH